MEISDSLKEISHGVDINEPVNVGQQLDSCLGILNDNSVVANEPLSDASQLSKDNLDSTINYGCQKMDPVIKIEALQLDIATDLPRSDSNPNVIQKEINDVTGCDAVSADKGDLSMLQPIDKQPSSDEVLADKGNLFKLQTVKEQTGSDEVIAQVETNSSDSQTVETSVSKHDENTFIRTSCKPADVGILCIAADQHERLITEIDEKVAKSDGKVNLSDLPQYNELKQLCRHLQSMVDQQLAKQERLQEQNERLAKQCVMASAATVVESAMSPCKKLGNENSTAKTPSQIVVLESTVERLRKELNVAKIAAGNHETAMKHQLAAARAEHAAKFEVLNRQYEECKRDKDLMVVRYAQAEQRNIELNDNVQKAEGRLKEWARERETAISRWNAMRADNIRAAKSLETNAAEITRLKRDLERQKELASSADVQAKFHQTRLKEEIDKHKETVTKLEETTQSIRELGSDMEKISQEIHDLNLFLEACVTLLKEVAGVLQRQKELTDEMVSYQEKVNQLDSERQRLAKEVNDLNGRLENQLQGAGNLLERVAEIDQLKIQLEQQHHELAELTGSKAELEQNRDDWLTEVDNCKKREAESLEFTQRITIINSQLQSEQIRLSAEMSTLKNENEILSNAQSKLRDEYDALSKDRQDMQAIAEQQRITLTRELTDQIQIARDAKQRIHDLEDEIKTIGRRHASHIKDLTRQLQMASRRLEIQDGKSNNSSDHDSASLHSGEMSDGGGPSSTKNEETHDYVPPVVEVVKVDRKMLLDKIVALQKKLARKNEKIDFLDDHVNHLTEDINRKNRIIKEYILTQDTGTMSTEKSDKLKAQLARKGGVMASLYSAQCQDGRTMSVELALEICNKMQALLEDTLLKNITLKESMDTLGQQVDVLLRENRQLRGHSSATQSLVQL